MDDYHVYRLTGPCLVSHASELLWTRLVHGFREKWFRCDKHWDGCDWYLLRSDSPLNLCLRLGRHICPQQQVSISGLRVMRATVFHQARNRVLARTCKPGHLHRRYERTQDLWDALPGRQGRRLVQSYCDSYWRELVWYFHIWFTRIRVSFSRLAGRI